MKTAKLDQLPDARLRSAQLTFRVARAYLENAAVELDTRRAQIAQTLARLERAEQLVTARIEKAPAPAAAAGAARKATPAKSAPRGGPTAPRPRAKLR